MPIKNEDFLKENYGKLWKNYGQTMENDDLPIQNGRKWPLFLGKLWKTMEKPMVIFQFRCREITILGISSYEINMDRSTILSMGQLTAFMVTFNSYATNYPRVPRAWISVHRGNCGFIVKL